MRSGWYFWPDCSPSFVPRRSDPSFQQRRRQHCSIRSASPGITKAPLPWPLNPPLERRGKHPQQPPLPPPTRAGTLLVPQEAPRFHNNLQVLLTENKNGILSKNHPPPSFFLRESKITHPPAQSAARGRRRDPEAVSLPPRSAGRQRRSAEKCPR